MYRWFRVYDLASTTTPDSWRAFLTGAPLKLRHAYALTVIREKRHKIYVDKHTGTVLITLYNINELLLQKQQKDFCCTMLPGGTLTRSFPQMHSFGDT